MLNMRATNKATRAIETTTGVLKRKAQVRTENECELAPVGIGS